MKATNRILAWLLTVVLMLGMFGTAFATDEPDTVELVADEASEITDEGGETILDLAALYEEASAETDAGDEPPESEAEDASATDAEGHPIQLDEDTTIEFSESEDDPAEILAEIMEEVAADALMLADEEEMLAPDVELLEEETEATLWINFKDPASAVSVQTDDGAVQTTKLYYISENDGVLYSLEPDDEAVETPVETDESGQAIIPVQLGASVHISVIGGYGHVIAAVSIETASGETMPASGTFTYDFIMEDDVALVIETEEVGVNTPSNESVVEGIQVKERGGVILNDPTVTLPAEESSGGSSGSGPRKISGSYWGTVDAKYEGGGTHPYPNGNSTGIFTISYGGKNYTGVCIDPSYSAPGSGSVGSWKEWYYYNVPIKDNPTFFAAIATSYYSNYGSTSGTVSYINLRDRKNWDQVGAYMYSYCRWDQVIDNSSYGHGFAMYHELLGYLANGWTWDRSVLGSSGIKTYIERTCNKIYELINPESSNFYQYAYNVLYTYRVFYYQSTTAGRQRIAWTVPRTDYGTVTIKKVSSKTGEPLPGCTITLTDVNDPNHKFTATTGDDGIATFKWVTWTTYTVEEVEPPEDYLLSYEAEDVAFTASYTYKSIADDPKTGTLEIVKLDHETKTPLAGATFQIKDENGAVVATATTGDDGKITVEDLYYGDYTYQEIEAPPLFQLDDTVYSFTIEGGDVVTHTREDIRIPGSITVLKTDDDGRPLSGVTYLLQYSPDNGQRWYSVFSRTGEDVTTGGCTSIGLADGKLTTDTDGIAKFEGLRADREILYRLTEVSTRNGQTLLKDPVYEGTLPVGDDSEPIFDISESVTDGANFQLPATGMSGYTAWLLLLDCFLAACLGAAIYLLKRFNQRYN